MQNIQFIESLESVKVDALILCHPQMEKEIDQNLKGAISFNDKQFSRPFWMTTNGIFPVPKLALINKDDSLNNFLSDATVAIAIDDKEIEKTVFDLLKNNPLSKEVFILCTHPKETQRSFEKYQAILEGRKLAKTLISAPANIMTPEKITQYCQALSSQGIKTTILDEQKLQQIGANALITVGKGSSNKPYMAIMEWNGSNEQSIALIGKGICYDAGGINLKTSHLNEMKWDKAGAGVVVGVMDILSKLQIPIHVIGIIVLAENMPDGNAMKPGDVITSLSGKTIEIIDTDCEGRMALADGIAYAQKHFSPQVIIDMATLTLETFGALGGEYAGLFCNDQSLSEQLIAAGVNVDEKLWPLPLGEYYAKQIYSKIADLKNLGIARYGASSAAAEFLRAFVDPKISWAHIDIAGTSWNINAPEEGVTLFGLELLLEFIIQRAGANKRMT